MDHTAEILKALADPSRYAIVSLLLRRDCCVGGIAKHIGISEAAVSQHLQVLRAAGVVRGEKRGYYTHYQVNRELLREAGDALIDLSNIQMQAGCGRHNHAGHCCGCDHKPENEPE